MDALRRQTATAPPTKNASELAAMSANHTVTLTGSLLNKA
jgi:hypothetical protein